MGILDRFKKKKIEPLLPLPAEPVKPILSTEPATMENLKAKIDLTLTHMDNLRIQYENLNERMKIIERLVTEIRSYCK